MKTKKLFLLLFAMTGLFAMSQTGCSKDEAKSEPEIFSDQISKVTMDAIDFIDKAITYETTVYNLNEMTLDEMNQIFFDFFDAGEAFASSLGDLLGESGAKTYEYEGDKDDDSLLKCAVATIGKFDISGVDASLAIKLGDIISSAKTARQDVEDAYNNGDLDEWDYADALAALPHFYNIGLEKIAGSAIMGAGASGLTGSAIAATAGGTAAAVGKYGLLVTFGVPAVVGGTIAYGSYRLFSWYTSSDKSGGETTHFLSFPWEFDKPIPAFLFGENASVAISMDGYAPVLIENLMLPDDDYNLLVEFDAIPYSDLDNYNAGGKSSAEGEVCYYKDPIIAGDNCDDVLFVAGEPHPPNPAPHQGVTVVATLMPATVDCEIHFSIIGTDGYSNSATQTSNQDGQASFYIPGAQPGVFDKVTITGPNGSSHLVSYYFGGAPKKDFDPATITKRQ